MSWYLRDGLKPRGPFEQKDVERLLRSGDLSPEDWLCSGTLTEWKPAREWEAFRKLPFPCEQHVGLHEKTAAVWVVLSKSEEGFRQMGPLSLEQIREALMKGRLRLADHLWNEGMSGWARLSSRPEFSDLRRLISPDL